MHFARRRASPSAASIGPSARHTALQSRTLTYSDTAISFAPKRRVISQEQHHPASRQHTPPPPLTAPHGHATLAARNHAHTGSAAQYPSIQMTPTKPPQSSYLRETLRWSAAWRTLSQEMDAKEAGRAGEAAAISAARAR